MTEERVDQEVSKEPFAAGLAAAEKKPTVYPPVTGYGGDPAEPQDKSNPRADDLVAFGDPKYAFCKSMDCVVNVQTMAPVDEPVFILRAQDIHASKTIKEYARLCASEAHQKEVYIRLQEFNFWREKHPDRIAEPD